MAHILTHSSLHVNTFEPPFALKIGIAHRVYLLSRYSERCHAIVMGQPQRTDHMKNWAHYLPTHADEEHLSAALTFALDIAKESGTSLVLAVNSKGSASFLEHLFSAPLLNKLRLPSAIPCEGVTVTLESTQTFDKYRTYGMVLAMHPSAKLLDLIASNEKTGDVIVIGDAGDIDSAWLQARGSRPLKPSQTTDD